MKFKKITCSILCISLLNIINPISNSVQASTNLPIPTSTQTETEKAFDMIPMQGYRRQPRSRHPRRQVG